VALSRQRCPDGCSGSGAEISGAHVGSGSVAGFRSHRGREIKTIGDGFLATFEGPARAVYCAHAIAEHVRPLGIEVRSGLHTGEVELDGDDIAGWASRSAPASGR
jgi:class 3 adenylate cyclase